MKKLYRHLSLDKSEPKSITIIFKTINNLKVNQKHKRKRKMEIIRRLLVRQLQF